ncbi:MAG: biopolymer transporter ExbD, partial [Bacteroidales bacterium]|nr:biopolymer transporter ExbD [Bacteroidales bacterium]
MAKRATPEINASSMADIAFLLLIFFLVTTTMDVDTGIQRQLPPIPENKDQKTDVEVNKRNIYLVLVNSRGNISVNQSWMDIDKLREDAKRFINCDRADDPTLPEMEEITVEGIKGPVKTSKGIISLQNDRGTTYGRYIEVQNELVAAYNEVRNEAARKYFNKPYDELNDEQQEAIRKIYPQ